MRAFGTSVARAAARTRVDVIFATMDTALLMLTFSLVLAIRYEGSVPSTAVRPFLTFLPALVAIHLACNLGFGLYRLLWRHAGLLEAQRLIAAGLLACLLDVAAWIAIRPDVPASVPLLGGMAAIAVVATTRFQARLFEFKGRRSEPSGLRIVIIGAGPTGAALIRDMRNDPLHTFDPVAVIDPDPRTHGRQFCGVTVAGALDRLVQVVADTGAHQAVLADPAASRAAVRRAAGEADRAGVPLRVAPSVEHVVDGRVTMRDVRDLEIEDLLGRRQVVTDLDAVAALLRGRRVLVTGAGGSIGSEIVRQVHEFAPALLVLVDHDETHLHDAALRLDGPIVQELLDIRDGAAVLRCFERHRPEVVFHAAAHKHVPLLELHPCEAVRTNVLGTANIVDAAVAVDVDRFVFISTDKAVQPSSVMGASKRVGEQLVLTSAGQRRWCAVRFGNVLGSRGSVVPIFLHQIAQGGPVTVTDERMTRFFMSIEESVQLVLQSTTFATGGELFMLEMGEPVRIVDLARRMIRLAGRHEGVDIELVVTGTRPGEKLHEALHAPEEAVTPTLHPSIVRLTPNLPPPTALARDIGLLESQAFAADDAAVIETLLSPSRTIRLTDLTGPDDRAVAIQR